MGSVSPKEPNLLRVLDDMRELAAENTRLRTVLREMVADSDDVDSGKLPRIAAATLTRARQLILREGGNG
jgi:hypothetical protein